VGEPVASAAPRPTFREMIEADRAYVMSTWIRSYHTARPVKNLSPRVYYDGQRAMIERILQRGAGVLVAADPAYPETVIWGWICAEPHVVHYVYVRPEMRRLGYGRELLEQFVDPKRFTYSHEPPPPTERGAPEWLRARLQGASDVIYDPYAVVR